MNKYTILVFAGLLLLSSFLIFKNLSNNYLWVDEAESAVLARNIIQFGYPTAFDGSNVATPDVYTGFGENYLWKLHPWLHFYLVSLSYIIFGESTVSARFPFAILGVLSIILIFFLAKRFFELDKIALLSVLFAATSVPLILMVRQCRYYGLQVFLVLAVVWEYTNVLKKKKIYLWLLGILLLTLCYTNHGAFLPVFGSIFVHFMLSNRENDLRKSFILMYIVVILLVIPWYIYSNTPVHIAALKTRVLKENLMFQIDHLTKYIFPLFFFLFIYLIRTLKVKSWKIRIDNESQRESLKFILLLIAINLCFWTFVNQRSIRYYVHVIPFLYILQAWIVYSLFNKKLLLTLVSILLIFTNIGHCSFHWITGSVFSSKTQKGLTMLLENVRFYLPEYIYEITHDYDGPIEGIVKYLEQHAKPGDEVKTPYNGANLIFYLPWLKINDFYFFNTKDFPKWIIWRDFWIREFKDEDWRHLGYKMYDEDYVIQIKENYIAHEIPYPDIPWENRPDDMEYHKFRTVTGHKNVIIYERKN